MGDSPLRRLRRFLYLCLRAFAGSNGFFIPGAADPMGDQPPCLPPGHPEHLIPHVPPTDAERRLWAQLVGASSPGR